MPEDAHADQRLRQTRDHLILISGALGDSAISVRKADGLATPLPAVAGALGFFVGGGDRLCSTQRRQPRLLRPEALVEFGDVDLEAVSGAGCKHEVLAA